MAVHNIKQPKEKPPRFGKPTRKRPRQRMAIIKGQDRGRWTDIYHPILTVPWSVFFLGVASVFITINTIFALAYMADPQGITNARPGNFWDAFLFSVETIGSLNYNAMLPKSAYANIIVVAEAFFGILNLAILTGVIFARISRPFGRILFSNVAVVAPYDGVPTLMLRAANQRGNAVLEAEVTITLAFQATSVEGVTMRRFEDLRVVRQHTSLFALSWTIMHRIDEKSPLHGATTEGLKDAQAEILVLLSGTDDTLADRIYARHTYAPNDILWNRYFVDVLGVLPNGRRVVDLAKFHDTAPFSTLERGAPKG
jgi:inward rectifier potassium channel